MKTLKELFNNIFSENNKFEKFFASNELNHINKEIRDLEYRRNLLENILLSDVKQESVFLRRV